MLFELELGAVLRRRLPAFAGVGKFQAVERDVAIWVNEPVTHAALMAAIWSADTHKLLKDARLFDVYRPKSTPGDALSLTPEKSLAVRLTLAGEHATLTDDQIDHAVQAVIARLAVDVGARQRVRK